MFLLIELISFYYGETASVKFSSSPSTVITTIDPQFSRFRYVCEGILLLGTFDPAMVPNVPDY